MEQDALCGDIEFDRRLLAAKSIMNSSAGVLVDLNVVDKFVYSYLSSRAKQSNFIGNYVEDSPEHIRMAIGSKIRSVCNSLKKLEKVGLIVKSGLSRKHDSITMYNVFSLDNFKMYTQRYSKILDEDGTVDGVEIVFDDSDALII